MIYSIIKSLLLALHYINKKNNLQKFIANNNASQSHFININD